MADDWTTLNAGSGGDSMDEEGVTYGGAPTTRKRARVEIGGSAAAALASVLNTVPVGTEYGIAARLVNGDSTTGSTALGALNAAIQVALAGQQGASFQLAAGTLIGTITPQVSMDGGTTWVNSFFDDPVTGNKAASIVFGGSNGLTIRTIVGAGGASHARVTVSAYTSGTANAVMRASMVNDPSVLFAGPPASTTQPPVAAQIAGWDGSNLRVPKIDANGLAYTRLLDAAANPIDVAAAAAIGSTHGIPTVASDGTNFRLTRSDTSGYLAIRVTDQTNFMPTMDVAARKGFLAITDGTNTAAVKAASTAPAAADPALVVALSPNSVTQQRSTTTTQTSVAATTTPSTTILAANTNRLTANIFNDSASATLYISENATGTTTQHTFQVLPGQGWSVTPGYTGIVTGVWSAAVGSARVTEYTP